MQRISIKNSVKWQVAKRVLERKNMQAKIIAKNKILNAYTIRIYDKFNFLDFGMTKEK